MNKRTRIATILIIMALVLFGAGITIAFIASASEPVLNTFTVGDIQLSLTETTGTTYQLIPGTTIEKDPTLTVKAGSDRCWLFFKATASTGLSDYVTYAPADGWTALAGCEGVYYRQVEKTDKNLLFPLLMKDQVKIRETVTEEQLAAVQTAPMLSFTGYAVQAFGIATAEEAWQHLISEGVTIR